MVQDGAGQTWIDRHFAIIDSVIRGVVTYKPKAPAEHGQSGAQEVWTGAGKGKTAATMARIAAEVVRTTAEMAKTAAKRVKTAADWSCDRAAWGSIAAGKVKAPTVTGYARAKQRMAGAEKGKTDRRMVTPLVGER